MARHPDAVVLCGAPRSSPYNWLTAWRAVEYAISLGIYRQAQAAMSAITVAPGCASLYRADTFKSLDFSGGTLVEDMDWTMQIHRRGLRLAYVPDAVVSTQDPGTISDYIGQISRWYRGTWQVMKRHRLCRHTQPIDWEMGLLAGEGLLFAVCVALLPLFLWFAPLVTGTVLVLDQVLLLSITLLVALRLRRWDILMAFPLFSIPRVCNTFVFLSTFVTSLRTTAITPWFSVRRRIA